MRCLLIFLALTVATAAHAQSPDWKNAFRSEYFKSSEEAFAIRGDEIYAFGRGARSLAAATNRYYFVRCGGVSGALVLSETDPEDEKTLRSLQIVNQGDARYEKLRQNYKDGCWSADVWKEWGNRWLDQGKKIFERP